jgi:hypothetical protein
MLTVMSTKAYLQLSNVLGEYMNKNEEGRMLKCYISVQIRNFHTIGNIIFPDFIYILQVTLLQQNIVLYCVFSAFQHLQTCELDIKQHQSHCLITYR